MTAVVGILNAKGVAIAADSATTYAEYKRNNSDKEEKLDSCSPIILNNGDKMLRLVDKKLVSVMILNFRLICSDNTHSKANYL